MCRHKKRKNINNKKIKLKQIKNKVAATASFFLNLNAKKCTVFIDRLIWLMEMENWSFQASGQFAATAADLLIAPKGQFKICCCGCCSKAKTVKCKSIDHNSWTPPPLFTIYYCPLFGVDLLISINSSGQTMTGPESVCAWAYLTNLGAKLAIGLAWQS